jgi:hypothetical protein
MRVSGGVDAICFSRPVPGDVDIEASGLPTAVLEEGRTERFTGGGGGGRVDGHGVTPDSELYTIEAGRDRACRVAYMTSAGSGAVALTGVWY